MSSLPIVITFVQGIPPFSCFVQAWDVECLVHINFNFDLQPHLLRYVFFFNVDFDLFFLFSILSF